MTDPGRSASLSLSVIVITRGRPWHLNACLQSVFSADLPLTAEVIVVCNGSDPVTLNLLASFATRDRRLRVLAIDPASPAAARNRALLHAGGEVIYFLDDDVTVVLRLFSRVLRNFAEHPEVMAIGGPNLTPLDSTCFQHCVGQVFASWLGAARVRDRFRRRGTIRTADESSLILCNLALRRTILSEEPFREYLVCNEENVLLGELSARGAPMLHDPNLIVYHRRRDTLRGLCAQVFRYGRGRWQNTLAAPTSLAPAYVIPPVFVVYLISTLVNHRWIYLGPVFVYLALVLGTALTQAYRSPRPKAFFWLLVLFPACHVSYGSGFLFQLLLGSMRGWERYGHEVRRI